MHLVFRKAAAALTHPQLSVFGTEGKWRMFRKSRNIFGRTPFSIIMVWHKKNKRQNYNVNKKKKSKALTTSDQTLICGGWMEDSRGQQHSSAAIWGLLQQNPRRRFLSATVVTLSPFYTETHTDKAAVQCNISVHVNGNLTWPVTWNVTYIKCKLFTYCLSIVRK